MAVPNVWNGILFVNNKSVIWIFMFKNNKKLCCIERLRRFLGPGVQSSHINEHRRRFGWKQTGMPLYPALCGGRA